MGNGGIFNSQFGGHNGDLFKMCEKSSCRYYSATVLGIFGVSDQITSEASASVKPPQAVPRYQHVMRGPHVSSASPM